MNRRRLFAAAVLGTLGFLAWLGNSDQRARQRDQQAIGAGEWSSEAAERAGSRLANGKCRGRGPARLTALPMQLDDFALIVPYGAVVGGHVTPIDHQYFSPRDFHSPRDAYERSDRGNVDIPVTSGQLIGKIGGQTLDFAVWDTEKPLGGFITPANYEAEPWKIFTADPLDYYEPEIRAQILSRYVRTVEPISGKIDYDVDGRLVGNWFQAGTKGYGGPRGEGGGDYWAGHLAFIPDVYVPSAYLVSIGDCAGEARQFALRGNEPSPAAVSVASGLVKYDLVPWSYVKPDGTYWDRTSWARDLTFETHDQVQGCALVQLTGERQLKRELFLSRSSDEVPEFTARARTYVR